MIKIAIDILKIMLILHLVGFYFIFSTYYSFYQ